MPVLPSSPPPCLAAARPPAPRTALLALLAALALAPSAFAQAPMGAPPAPPEPPKQIVADVLIQGCRMVPSENVKNQLTTRVGREYVPETLQEDVRRLYAGRQFANVRADVRDLGRNRVTIIVVVQEYSSMVEKVAFLNNHALSNDDLEGIAGVRPGTPLNPQANRLACAAIVRRLNEEGRPFASCTLLRGAHLADREVVFNIDEGPKVRVRDIRFTGNTFVRAAVLETHIQSARKFLGLPISGTYNAALAESDVHELTKYYRAFGFLDVRMNREVAYTHDAGEVTLVFHINEGVRYQVAASPIVLGVRPTSAAALEAFIKVKAGDYYDENKINADTGRVRDWFGYRGYDVRVTAVPVFLPDRPGFVAVHYEVKGK
jgi:outer membrane protein insertion porin family